MIILEASKLKHEVKERLLFDIDSLHIYSDDRIGFIGRNGCGKTTLLNILASDEVTMHGHCELLPQLKHINTTKSGGEVTKEYIDQALSKHPDLLLADEPTTNLDTTNIELLQKELARWQGAFVIVSHDRAFLDSVCTSIWELNDGKLRIYKGNYSDYRAQKEVEQAQHEHNYERYIKKKKQLEEALILKEKKAERATKKPKRVSPSEASIIGAKPYFANKQKKLRQAAKAIETRLEKLEAVEKWRELPAIKMNIPNEEGLKERIILRCEEVDGTIGQRILWKNATFHVRAGDKIALIGKNGCGKTTLVKKIINQNPGITISPAVKIGYFSQNLDILQSEETILENVRSTSIHDETLIRTVLARLHFFKEDVYKKIEQLSGGERVKVALAKLFVSDVNMLILDEPTNFLDVYAIEALEALIQDYKGTVLFVSHDLRLIETTATRILTIENQEVTMFEGSYEDYQNPSSTQTHQPREDQRLFIETKISEVLSRLSIEPSAELEKEFERLLKEKKMLDQHS